ncbi:hypothetical protein G210_2772 [Candida maltosa Xu316]|uniref:Uncharacterized protein n=1 Tax=Candida maltosa (strain Xu316) TaxID=1245528 RepID=M3HI13_CANMX|nr:hypothetical protein G210_2772 [Candida maltosa Xu316]
MASTAVVDRRLRRKSKKDLNGSSSSNVESTPSSGISTPEVIEEQEFENDLDYLLTNKETDIHEEVFETPKHLQEVVISDAFPAKSKTKTKKPSKAKAFTVADVTKDMEGLDFSSDEEEQQQNEESTKPKKPRRKSSSLKLNRKKSKPKIKDDKDLENDQSSKSNGRTRSKKVDDSGITGDPDTPSKPKRNRNRKKSKENLNGKKEEPVKEDLEAKKDATEIPVPNTPVEEDEEAIQRRKLRNKKRQDRRKKRSQLINEAAAAKEAANTTNNDADDSNSTPPPPAPLPTASPSNTPVTTGGANTPSTVVDRSGTSFTAPAPFGTRSVFNTPEKDGSPFTFKLRPVKSTINKKYSENLPEVQPVKTIIGMSHQQILHSDLSDVKIKTLMTSSSISKYAANSVKFVTTHKEDLFDDYEKKKIFLTLCINIALYESLGFKKTVKLYPDVLSLFSVYDEINLETTRTKLTPSKKDIHQNNLDYSVLSYFGHILIWAAHQQRQGKVPIFTDKFDISLSNNEVRSKIGGYHLWDKLFRELKGMNSKRWKHVIKFRNAFQYEEDQFMIILRFMQIDDNIP